MGTELPEMLIQFGEKQAAEQENDPSWCLLGGRQGLMGELVPLTTSERR